MFKTSESGGKGQLLDGDPSYVTNDEALVKNLDLDYQVVVGGSEAALLTSFKNAEKNKTPLLAYFYTPQWYAEVDGQSTPGVKDPIQIAHVKLPKWTEGCDSDPAKVACDYPPYHLNKLISTKFADSGSPAVAADQELQLDQRRPEPGLELHRPGRHVPGRRGPEVDRRQPGQGRRLAPGHQLDRISSVNRIPDRVGTGSRCPTRSGTAPLRGARRGRAAGLAYLTSRLGTLDAEHHCFLSRTTMRITQQRRFARGV